jgi:hypothetical protein
MLGRNNKGCEMEKITRYNCRLLLAAFIKENELTARGVAHAIGCPEASLLRILGSKTKPSDELLKQVGTMIGIGFERYQKLSDSEKNKISEKLGAVGGGTLGFASIAATVSSFGSVAGLSAAGISSGLAALGTIVGGSMIAGVSVAAAIPLAAGAIGYGVIKGGKYFFGRRQLNTEYIDPKWEISKTTE